MKTGFWVVLVATSLALVTGGCAKKDTHWGQKLEIDKKWWKQEGQSWDRKNKVFMAIGYSNPDWKEKYDLRKSADLDARSQVAAFMNTLVKNYMEEVRAGNYSISEHSVRTSANEAIIGAVIVDRHYDKKNKQYLSLIKIDMKYFFDNIYDRYKKELAGMTKTTNNNRTIDEKIKEAIEQLKRIEEPVVEKTIKEVE